MVLDQMLSLSLSTCQSHSYPSTMHVKPGSQYGADADVDTDADAGIEMNPIPASALTSKDAACVKAVSLTLS